MPRYTFELNWNKWNHLCNGGHDSESNSNGRIRNRAGHISNTQVHKAWKLYLNPCLFAYMHLIVTAQLWRLVYKRAPSAAPIVTSSCVSMCSSSALSSSSCRVKTLTEKACGSSLLSSILGCERKGRGKRAEEVESRERRKRGGEMEDEL